ncbi:MAG: putative transrane protein [Noviherbaspirillum sp.]|nr:putative transrane protein [Noviherbaspirillum sp.]
MNAKPGASDISSRLQGTLRQRGAALVIALFMLIAVLLLSISGSQIALQEEKASRQDRDHQIAFQAAEAALMDAELDIENSPSAAKSRSAIFSPHRTEGFTPGCGAGNSTLHWGLCTRAPEGDPPIWQTVDFFDQSANARSVPYGYFTGHVLQTGVGTLPARAPRYVIELIPYNRAGEEATIEDRVYFYRITAIGFGARDSTQVVLQTFYRKDGNQEN